MTHSKKRISKKKRNPFLWEKMNMISL